MALARIKRGDNVKAIAGKERGKTGKVIEVLTGNDRVRVEGMMVVKRHVKKGRSQAMPEGGIIEKNGTVHVSNLLLVCPACNEASRVGQRVQEDGPKVRYCKKCNQSIE
jgi:large subunit ribosomal protein L24